MARFGESVVPQAFSKCEQFVLKCFHQVGLGDRPHIGIDKHSVEKTGHQRSVIRPQQAPSRVVTAEQIKGREVKSHGVFRLYLNQEANACSPLITRQHRLST